MTRIRIPKDTNSRLDFKPGKRIVLKFETARKNQLVWDEGVIVFEKQTRNDIAVRRVDKGQWIAINPIDGATIADPLDQIVLFQFRQMMLKIEIEALLCAVAEAFLMFLLGKVGLQSKIGPAESMFPS
jgi:hypothetical protein